MNRWAKRLGVLGFLFFLVKGLLWLILPAALVYFGVSAGDAAENPAPQAERP